MSTQLFMPGDDYGSKHPKNGKAGARCQLFWFCVESGDDWKDRVHGWLTRETFNRLAEKLSVPKLEELP